MRLLHPLTLLANPAWWSSRNWWYFLQGLPAVVVSITCLVLLLSREESGRNRAERYLVLAHQANESNQPKPAQVYAEAALKADPEGFLAPNARLELATAASNSGDRDRAIALLMALAPADRKGYKPAHLLIAQNLLAHPPYSPEKLLVAESHLLRAAEPGGMGEVSEPQVQLLLGEIYLSSRRFEDAKRAFTSAGSLVLAQLRLGQIDAAQGNRTAAHTASESCAHFYETKLAQDRTNVQLRTFFVEALVLKEDYQRALATVEEGLVLSPNNPALRRLRASLYSNWLAALESNAESTPEARLALLDRALTAEPGDTAFLLRLWNMTDGKQPKSSAAQDLLRKLLAEGRNKAMAHFVLGTTAWQEGQFATARMHLEQAYRDGPKVPVIGNNLAWILAEMPDADLKLAVEVIDSVIRQAPEEPRYRGTRGRVYLKMKRWSDALPDLEASLKNPSAPADTHELLATVYQALGDQRMAEQHRKLVPKNSGK